MAAGGGPGMGRGERVSGVALDPLIGLDDERKPLRSRLLKVPAYRERYLALVREINDQWLTWEKLGPTVKQYADLMEKEVEKDTRKLAPFDAFKTGVGAVATAPAAPANPGGPGGFGRGSQMSLKSFIDQRHAFLTNHPAVKAATAKAASSNP